MFRSPNRTMPRFCIVDFRANRVPLPGNAPAPRLLCESRRRQPNSWIRASARSVIATHWSLRGNSLSGPCVAAVARTRSCIERSPSRGVGYTLLLGRRPRPSDRITERASAASPSEVTTSNAIG